MKKKEELLKKIDELRREVETMGRVNNEFRNINGGFITTVRAQNKNVIFADNDGSIVICLKEVPRLIKLLESFL